MRFLISIVLFALVCNYSNAQKKAPWCIVGDRDHSGDSSDRRSLYVSPTSINTARSLQTTRLINNNGVIVIPVVFHVVYNLNDPPQNVSDNLIIQTLARLNTDFRKQNTDLDINHIYNSNWLNLAADMQFEFKMACYDPQGVSTNGIVRVGTTHSQYQPGSSGYDFFAACLTAQGGDDAWATDTYLNVWICDMSNKGGAAMLPDQRLLPHLVNGTSYAGNLLDGVLIDYTNVGDPSSSPDFSMGRLLTHEAGHWLGLLHLWGDNNSTTVCTGGGSDGVGDTPPQEHGNYGCPLYPATDNCTNSSPGVMFMNYMDYTDDPCKVFFTAGQKTRARSYFSSGGPTGTRYDFIYNYFHIKPPVVPVQIQNNTITIYLQNPACFTVGWIVSGPATVVQQNNQRIILSVECGASGTIDLSAHTTNYTDDISFNFSNTDGLWPKLYYGKAPTYFGIAGDGNMVMFLHENTVLTPNVNHEGVLPGSPYTGEYTYQYDTHGYTNWTKTGQFPRFILSTGDVQMDNSTYVNIVTGNTVTGPSTTLVPTGEIIVAEVSPSVYITKDNSNLYVHTSSGSAPPVACNNCTIYDTKFNPSTNTLFVYKIGWWTTGEFNVYTLSGNVLTQTYARTFSTAYDDHLSQITNQNTVYIVKSGVLQQYNYTTNSFATPTIAGFNNTTINSITPANPYTEDRCMLAHASEENIYYFDLLTFANKKIQTTGYIDPINWSPASGYFAFRGNIVFLAGPTSSNMTIGNQTFTLINGLNSIYLTRFCIDNDFTSKTTMITNTKKADEVLNAELHPNPAHNLLKIIINESSNKKFTYTVSIHDQNGQPVLTGFKYFSGKDLNISNLKPGVYFVEISDNKGNKVSRIMSKL